MNGRQTLAFNTIFKRSYFKIAAGIFCFAFFFRALLYLFFLCYDPGTFGRYGDSANYTNAANNMLSYRVFCDQNVYPPYPGVFRTPGYPVFMAVIYFFSGSSDAAVVFVQLILATVNCVLVFFIAVRFASKGAAVLAAVLLSVDIASIKSANEIMTETLFTFILLVFILLMMSFFEYESVRLSGAGGLVCAAGALIRPILLYFLILTPFILLIHFKKKIRPVALYSIAFISAFALLVSPWIYRNARVGYKGFAAVQEVNIYIFKAGWIEERLKGSKAYEVIDFKERFERVDRVLDERGISNTPYNRIKVYKELGLKTILDNPGLVLKYQVIYTLRIFTITGIKALASNMRRALPGAISTDTERLASVLYGAMLYCSYFLFLAGAGCAISSRSHISIYFIIILFCYITALSGEWGAGSRFRTPVMPLVLIISAIGTDKIQYFIKNILRTQSQK